MLWAWGTKDRPRSHRPNTLLAMASRTVIGACPLRGHESHLSSGLSTDPWVHWSRPAGELPAMGPPAKVRAGSVPGRGCSRRVGLQHAAAARGDGAPDAAEQTGRTCPHAPAPSWVSCGPCLAGAAPAIVSGALRVRQRRWGFWGEGHMAAASGAVALAGRWIRCASPPGSLPAFREIMDERGSPACLSCGPPSLCPTPTPTRG